MLTTTPPKPPISKLKFFVVPKYFHEFVVKRVTRFLYTPVIKICIKASDDT
jgi:hypothetical protein